MEVKNILTLKVKDNSHVYEARRLTATAAKAMGFSETDVGRISIIVTELVTNLVKHSNLKDSTFIAQKINIKNSEAIELLTIDKGPGMKNAAECMRDGYSTAGSSGNGLGSVNRLSDFFDIYTQPGTGTVILSQVKMDNKKNDTENFMVGALCIPLPGEEVNGDKWACIEEPDRFLVVTADGLGHGVEAGKASSEAVKGFEDKNSFKINEIMLSLHNRLAHTRGAAVALTEIIPSKNLVRFCSIGNISGCIINDNSIKNMISQNGIIGHESRKINVMEYPWTDSAMLMLYSDGIISRWSFEKYPGLQKKSLPVIAGVFYRDFQRGNDDLTVIFVRKRK